MNGFTVVFDLDGTLVDTAPDLLRATNHVLASVGLAPIVDGEIRPRVSLGARSMIERGLELHGTQLPRGEIDRLFEAFLAYYADNVAVDSRPFDGLGAALDALEAGGARLAVCTNKREDLSRLLLRKLGMEGRFKAICGRDTFAVCKPHPDHLNGTIEAAGGDRRRAVMVGDSDVDVSTARAAGIPIIGVSFGYTQVPMRELRPDALIDHYAEFHNALRGLPISCL